jgi:hypothetical protein
MFMTAPYTHPVGFGPPRTQPDARQGLVRLNPEGCERPSDDGAATMRPVAVRRAGRGSGPPDADAASQQG